MVVDWQADLEKKVANLLRKFKAEAEARGDDVEVEVSVVVKTKGENIPTNIPTVGTDAPLLVPTDKEKKNR